MPEETTSSTTSETVDVVSQQKHVKVVSHGGEEDYVVEFAEDVEALKPPQIIKPLQPVAVHEGMCKVHSLVIYGCIFHIKLKLIIISMIR